MLARLAFLSCQWGAQERLATDGTPWKLTRNGKGQFVTMGKRVNTQRSSVCRQMGSHTSVWRKCAQSWVSHLRS